MVTETVFNIYPIIKITGYFIVIAIGLFLLHNSYGVKLFVKKDEKIAEKFFDKFPLVLPDFFKKTQKEQTLENNQEIHELNKRIEHLEEYIEQLNKKIDSKLEIILKEVDRG